MAEGQFASILHFIRKLTGSAPACAASDGQLLERFARDKDEDAFTALTARHGPMVLGVCQRVLRDRHEAEDAFQATFLVLARKAAAVRQHSALASWLCKVAYHVALATRQRAERQQEIARQAGAAAQGEPMAETAGWDLRQVLDEELNRLPKKYHAPVVLCYLEGKTCAEAAEQLDWPAGTVKVRLMRARELLRARLERRGLALSAAALSAGLAPEALAASVPAGLAEVTLKSAVAFAAGKTAAHLASSAAIAIAEGVLKAMGMRLRKMVAAVALLATLVGTGLCWQVLGAAHSPATPLVAFAPVPAGEEPEPRYQGKPVAHWIDVLQDSPVVSCRIEAIQALANIDAPRPTVLPSLEKALRTDADHQVRSTALAALGKIAATDATTVPMMLEARNDQSPAVRQTLVQALAPLAGQNEQAVLALVDALKDKDTRTDALRALYRLGPQAAAAEPALRAALEDVDRPFGLGAAVVLSRVVKAPQSFDPVPLLRAARPEDREWLPAALYSDKPQESELPLFVELGRLDQLSGTDGVALLAKMLGDASRGNKLRMDAAVALGRMGASAREALPALTQALQDQDPAVRHAAAVAHWRLAAEADKVVPVLAESLKSENVERSRASADLLREIGSQSKEASQSLVEALKSKDKSVRLAAALAHWRMAHDVAVAGPILAELLQDTGFHIPVATYRALQGSFSTEADVPLLLELLRRRKPNHEYRGLNLDHQLGQIDAAVPELLKALTDDNLAFRQSAARILRDGEWFQTGEGADPVRPVKAETLQRIEEALTHATPAVRQWALFVWARQPDRDRALAAVLRGLYDPAADVRQVAVAAVGSIGPKAKDAVPQLIQAIWEEPQLEQRLQAAGAVWAIDPAAGALRDGLLKLLHDHPQKAASFLASKGPKALPVLRRALADADARVRLGAIGGVGHLAGAPPEMVAWDLNHALEDPDVQVRKAAAEALLRVQVTEPQFLLQNPGVPCPKRSSVPLPASRLQKALDLQKNDKGQLPAGTLALVPKFGKDAAQPVLRSTLNDPLLRVEAAALLGDNLDPTTRDEVVKALTTALRDKNPMWQNALPILGQQGAAAMIAVPTLRDILKDPDSMVRIAAAGALWKIDPQQEATIVPVLCDVLRLKKDTPAPQPLRVPLPPSSGHAARTAAAQVLQEMAPAGKEAIPLLIEALREESLIVPSKVPRPPDPYHPALREALRRYGKEAVPHLIKVLAHDLGRVRESAFGILAEIGPQAKDAVPALLDALVDKDPNFRAAAAAALKKIDPEAAAKAGVQTLP